jgi:hypothetical protein
MYSLHAFVSDDSELLVIFDSLYSKTYSASICCSIIDVGSKGDVYFTDSGPMGETGLHSPKGSLYLISSGPSGQVLQAISHENLAGPTGVAVTSDGMFM